MSFNVFAMSPLEQAKVLYIRICELQEEMDGGDTFGMDADQVDAFATGVEQTGMLVRSLLEYDDREDLDDDDRTEIHEGDRFLEGLRSPVDDSKTFIIRAEKPVDLNGLAQVEKLIRQLEALAWQGSALEGFHMAIARWAGFLGLHVALPERLEQRRNFQERVRAIRTMFGRVEQHYRFWVLVDDEVGRGQYVDAIRANLSLPAHAVQAVHVLIPGAHGCGFVEP